MIFVMMALLACHAAGQNTDCREISAIARMARGRSIAALNAQHEAGGETYRSRLVFAIKRFQLTPKDRRAAAELLQLIPTEDREELVAKSFGSLLCDAEPMADVKALGALGDRIARDLAAAVLLVPQKMDSYVVYAAEAVQDPDSDYAIQMEPVCRARHEEFVKAVENLGAGAPEKGYFATASSDWFRKHIFDPNRCRALAIPEAE